MKSSACCVPSTKLVKLRSLRVESLPRVSDLGPRPPFVAYIGVSGKSLIPRTWSGEAQSYLQEPLEKQRFAHVSYKF
mgnify:CR=1 FL=1